MPDTWDDRIAAVWSDEALSDADRVERIDALAAERGEHDPVALFERAGARDSAGLEGEAERLYVRALAGGLDEARRQRAVIQLASTIRNLGRTQESLAMLREEYHRADPSPMRDAVAAFYALALVSSGQHVAGASIALTALAPHLPRYTRSVTGYAEELLAGRS